MANVVIMPKQGQSVESCIVTEFIKKVGERVSIGDVLFCYETDKATFEEESKYEGTVLACFFKEGDEIPCLTNVMVIGEEGESYSEFDPSSSSASVSSDAPVPAAAQPENTVETEDRLPSISTNIDKASASCATSGVSPRARMYAANKGINTDQVAGSGPYGRVIERDVKAAAEKAPALTSLAKAKMSDSVLEAPAHGTGLAGMVRGADLVTPTGSHTVTDSGSSAFEDVKMSNMRKLIAKSMFNSLQTSAQLTHMVGADARKIQELRKKAKKAFEKGEIDANITINDFVCYATIKTLQKFPNLNSHCLGDTMRLFKSINLGCAVDTERGLMVPTVLNADELNITGLSKQLKKIAEDAKKGSVNPDLLSPASASFTVSNLGGFGVEWFTPIINVPQSAILGVGTIVLRPKDIGGGVVAFVPYMGLSLTYDHRAVDGSEATRFLKQLASEIENLDIDF